jgi:TRAP transporter 4TM/12TM fusion protein
MADPRPESQIMNEEKNLRRLQETEGEEGLPKRRLPENLKRFVRWVAICMSVWQVFVLAVYPMDPFQLRAIHLCFTLVLTFFIFKIDRSSKDDALHFLDIPLCLAAVASTLYIFLDFDDLIQRTGVDPTFWDVVFGTFFVLLVLEMTRRTTGYTLVILASLFIGYTLFGQYLPGGIRHGGYGYARMVSFLFSTEGIFTIPLGVSSTYVFLFILFGSFLSASGAGTTFTDLAKSVAGWARGGPAKISVIASSLFGTISGSAVANVMVDGWMTIPLMKNVGYRPQMAGAVEAVASTGGQIMPPVMGAGAFIMAEVLGLTYTKIIVAATIPAILYYFALYWMIDFEALRYNLKGIPRAQLPRALRVLSSQGHLLLPIVVLLFSLIVMQTSPIRAGLWSSLAIILVSFIRRATHMGWGKISEALEGGAKGILEVAATCACAGIIIGVMALTGLGGRITAALMALSGNSLILALFLTMIVSFILGMGLPTTAAYVICASTIAPALTHMGIPPLAAHMFIFYFACLSAITPPVALAAFAAAGIAQTGLWGVGLCAVKIAAAGYIIPYMFVYGPPLLMIGSWGEIIYSLATACVGTVCLAGGLQGWFVKVITWPQRIFLISAAVGLIKPGWVTDVLGAILLIIVIGSIKMGYYKKEEVPILIPGVGVR